MNKRKLVERISKDAFLSTDVVEDVLEALVGVLIEELVRTGKTSFYGMFNISSFKRKGYTNNTGYIPPGEVLRTKLSGNVKKMFNNFGPTTGKSHFVNSKNWRDFLKYVRAKEQKEREAAAEAQTPSSAAEEYVAKWLS